MVGQMPVGWVEKVMAGIGGGAGNGTAGLIAKGAEKMMVMAKVKVAAVVAVGLLGVGLWAGAAGSGTQPASRSVAAAQTSPAAAQEQREVVNSLIKRLRILQNIEVEYQETCSWYPPPTPVVLANGERVKFKDGTQKWNSTFRYLEGKAFYDCRLSDASIEEARRKGEPAVPRGMYAFTGDVAEQFNSQLTSAGTQPSGAGLIGNSIRLPQSIAKIDVGLGLRLSQENRWMSEDRLRAAEVGQDAQGRPTASLRDEGGAIHTWTLDPVRQYAIVACSVRTKNGELREEMECGDFEEIGGVSLPRSVTCRNIRERLPPRISVEDRTEIIRYVLNSPTNTAESYHIVWPNGSEVYDERTETTHHVGSGNGQIP